MRDSMTETPEAAPVHGSPRQVLEVHVGEVGVPRPHVLVGQPEVVELARGGVRGEQRDTLARGQPEVVLKDVCIDIMYIQGYLESRYTPGDCPPLPWRRRSCWGGSRAPWPRTETPSPAENIFVTARKY